MESNLQPDIQLQGSLMNLLEPGELPCIQDVVAAFPERKWVEVFEAIELLSQNRRVSFKFSLSELRLRAFQGRQP